jgi:RNA polymerase sigma-70 factor (ECF subfamily)
MLELQEAAVRQRLVRARKQFQQLYALENGEQVTDNGTPATSTGMMRQASSEQNHEGRVESRLSHEENLLDAPPSLSRRSYGEQLYRNSITAPLW